LVVFLRENILYYQTMTSLPSKHPVPFDRPASYRIKVQGLIDPGMSDFLGGMLISQAKVESRPSVTTLEGELRDQAALAGVLNSLYELHLPVLSVTCLEI
jgi:hypothetical protein